LSAREDLLDPRRVVELQVGALVRGPRVVGAIQLGAQFARVGVGEDRGDDRALERCGEAFQTFVRRGAGEHRAGRFGKAGKLGFGQRAHPSVGGIEHGAAELRGEPRELVLDFRETFARRAFQRHAGQAEAAQAVFDHGTAGAVEPYEIR
jgi:hypothetical protein